LNITRCNVDAPTASPSIFVCARPFVVKNATGRTAAGGRPITQNSRIRIFKRWRGGAGRAGLRRPRLVWGRRRATSGSRGRGWRGRGLDREKGETYSVVDASPCRASVIFSSQRTRRGAEPHACIGAGAAEARGKAAKSGRVPGGHGSDALSRWNCRRAAARDKCGRDGP
jgi:hypothetical protein